MSFTPEQITFLENLIDQRINLSKRQGSTRPVVLKDYHTIPEIRELIVEHVDVLRSELGNGEFDVAVFRHMLAKQTCMRPGDLQFSCENHNKSRWDAQVLNAIDRTVWPDCPIEPGSKRRHYRFKSLADAID